MAFTKPLWDQGTKEFMTSADVEADTASVRELEALVPIEPIVAAVESVFGGALHAAVALPLVEDEPLDEDVKRALKDEFARVQGELAQPDLPALAALVRTQLVRYWAKILWAALERWPKGVRLGASLLPTRETRDSDWQKWEKIVAQRTSDLLAYLSLSRPAFEGITRVFVGAVQQQLLKGPIALPRGIRVTLRPDQEVFAHRGPVPSARQEERPSTQGNRTDLG